MSDIVKNIFSTTDKLNLFSNTKNLESMLSRIDTFSSGQTEEERRQQLCNMVIATRVIFVLIIFMVLFYANRTGKLSDLLFMGLSLLTLLMPDIVVIILVIYFAVNTENNTSTETTDKSSGSLKYLSNLNNFSDTSEGPSSLNKYALTQTPEVFN